MRKSLTTLMFLIASAALTACGGGGGTGTVTPPPPPTGSIAGTAAKGPINGGMVTAYALNNGAMGAEITHATTDANGNFSLSMGSYAGAVMLQLSGGSYSDEATGTTMTMLPGDVMTAVVPDMTSGQALSGIQVTPLTAMAQAMAQHMAGGMTQANINAANTAVGSYFMVGDILHNVPIDPLTAGSGASGATQAGINYGMTLAAISQYAHTQGMSSSSAMVTAMANDAADGVMDGMMAGNNVMMGGMGMGAPLPVTAGTSGLGVAMSTFMSSAQNHSGVVLATVQSLIDKLNGSNGQMMSGGTGGAVNGKLSGTVFNGAMHSGTVTAYAVTGGARGPQIASTALDVSGHFSMSLGTYAGPVMLQVTAGTFSDEATDTTMQMGTGDVMTAVLPSITSGADVSGLCISALTSMAEARAAAMNGGMTDANITAANTGVGGYFMVSNMLTTQPIDMTMSGSGTAAGVTQDEINYGAVIAAMSQYAQSIGMTTSSAFVTAMMQDASDGTMNGMMNGAQIQMGGMMGGGMMSGTAGTSGLATAMTNFMDSAMDHSGLTSTNVNALIQQLAASNGRI